ncbi:hypothetical protein PIB30_053421 [Stylosanthes scabra]|uniref:Uncharacterized protein n=1 Tax=Stylosanthes scabra TaxID=79078 RepID=A0ABU6YJ50_9FABA|nr:hypothetical protein [Stylosanthes scabra]
MGQRVEVTFGPSLGLGPNVTLSTERGELGTFGLGQTLFQVCSSELGERYGLVTFEPRLRCGPNVTAAELDKLGPSDDEDLIWEDSDDEDSEEEELNEEEGEEEDGKEEVNEGEAKEESEAEEEEETFFVATMFEKSQVDKLEIKPKCEDPGPCLVTCEIRGVNILDFLCNPGAYGSVMPYKLHALLDLGPLRKSNDFHVIRATKGSKGGMPQVLLGRPFLKTAGFQLDYISETFSFKVGNFEETFHPVQPPSLLNKSAQQLQLCNGRDSEEHVVREVEDKISKDPRSKIEKGKGLRDTPPRMKKKKKELVKHTARKINREGDSSREKIE